MSLKKKKNNPENNWHWLSSWAVGYEETDTGVQEAADPGYE